MGHPYTHPVIPVWNAFVRSAFFVVTVLLLTTLRKSLRAQQDLARTDALTGLCGRREFDARLEHDLTLARRRGGALTLAFVDVDDFKAVNDAHGHAGGDRALRAIAGVLSASLRRTDTAARLGGDEFALVLPDTDGAGARRIVSSLALKLREDPVASRWGVTCSIGVVTFLSSASSPEHIVAAADALMYQVKRGGKGAIAFSVLGEAVQPDAATQAPQSPGR
jgi:diguanylate cyclase (GGDEF)-like protein